MRLLQPSPGESYDRLTILALKIAHSGRKEFQVEHDALSQYMIDNHYHVPTDLGNELARINGRLWGLENEQRVIVRRSMYENTVNYEDTFEFCQNAKTIIQLNDARAETVKKINEALGINSIEKVYSE